MAIFLSEDILQQIRRNFIISDDSSICEKICHSHDSFTQNLGSNCGSEENNTSDSCRRSPEIPFIQTPEYSIWHNMVQQKHERLPSNHTGLSIACFPEGVAEQVISLSDMTPQIPPHPADKHRKSALTLALEKSLAKKDSANSTNRFNDFAVFDARSADNQEMKYVSSSYRLRNFTVWFWRILGLPKLSITVRPTVNCSVRELVGLALWQYFNEIPSAAIAFNAEFSHVQDAASIVNGISVYMFDSQDDLDADFPPLQYSDPVYKYEFDALAFVETTVVSPSSKEKKESPLVLVSVHLAQGISLMRFTTNASLQVVLDCAIKRRQLRQHEGYAYHLERWVEPLASSSILSDQPLPEESRKPLDLTRTLADFQANDLPLRFVLIRDHSRYDPAVKDSDYMSTDLGPHNTASNVAAPLLPTTAQASVAELQTRKYRATQLRGLSSLDVQLTISGDRLDVQPSRLPKLFRTSKTLSVSMQNVVDCFFCATSSDRPLSKVQFTISYLPLYETGSSNKKQNPPSPHREDMFNLDDIVNLLFETQWASARAICHQINLIFACTVSHIRRTYSRLRLSES